MLSAQLDYDYVEFADCQMKNAILDITLASKLNHLYLKTFFHYFMISYINLLSFIP